MDYLIMGGQLMLSLSILIVLHEFGHYLPAKWFKIRAEKFYLFFDPYISLFKAKKLNGSWQMKTALSKDQEFENDDPDQTEWGMGWLPLGGYVKIAGMIDESFDAEQMEGPPQDWEFRSKPAWQRLIVMLGGVTVNFILGFFLLGMVLWGWGESYLPAANAEYGIYVDSLGYDIGLRDGDKVLKIGDKPFEKFNPRTLISAVVIDGVNNIEVERNGQRVNVPISPEFTGILSSHETKSKEIFGARMPVTIGKLGDGYPAKEAGFQVDDQLIAINGKSTLFFDQFSKGLKDFAGKTTDITLLRGGDTMVINSKVTDEGRLGFNPFGYDKYFEISKQKYSLMEALPMGFSQGYDFLASQIKAFGRMFSGEIAASESLGGFGTFASIFGNTWEWAHFWKMTGIISLILAFMNLLPIPALDGGHVMFLLYEMVSGRKPSDKFLEYATMFGFILVFGLVIYANGLDIMRGCF